MGPLLAAHRATASFGAQVQPTGGGWDEVSNASGKPVDGGGKSGSYSASGEAGVCILAFVKSIGAL